MGGYFFAQLLWIPSLVGVGLGFARALHYAVGGAKRWNPNLGELGLMGVSALCLIGMVWNLFAPVTSALSVSLIVSGWISLCLLGGDFRYKNLKRELLWFLPIAASVNFAGITGSLVFDTGLYHLPSTSWILATKTPLGVANALPWLAYNSAWFPFVALLHFPAGRSSLFAANPILVIFAFSMMIERFQNLFRKITPLSLGQILILVSLLFSNYLLAEVGGISPDIPSRLFSLCGILLIVLSIEESAPPAAALAGYWWMLVAMSAKMSSSPGAIAAVHAIVGIVYFQYRKSAPRILIVSAGLAGILIGPWLIRGLFLSGCFIFPVEQTCVPNLSWSYGAPATAGIRKSVANYAGRELFVGLPFNELFSYPLRESTRLRKLIFVTLMLPLAWFVTRPRKRRRENITIALHVWTGGLSIAWMALSYFSAPDVRHCLPGALCACATLVSLVLSGRTPNFQTSWAGFVVPGIALALVVRTFLLTMQTSRFVAWPGLDPVPQIARRTASGDRYTSVGGITGCWMALPPCNGEGQPPLKFSIPTQRKV